MKAWKRHTFVLVAWIFLFPVLYQPVHIVHHHSHERHDRACEHKHHHTETATDKTRISHSHNDCYICEYEFVIKDLPGVNELVNAPIRYDEVKTALTLSHDKTRSFTQIIPRAPPQS